jgi:Lon protease-like protein
VQSAPKHPVPVFPLPGTVLFPHALLPLHVFELRYRTMVREALSGERLIAMALLKPGWEADYEASPDFYPLGCLARFEEVEWLPNDCYNLKVLGLSRVRFGRVMREYPYRAARLTILPQEPYSEDDPLIELEKRALIETMGRWRAAVREEGEAEAASVAGEIGYEAVVNAMCMHAAGGPLNKLELLELDSVVERGRRIREVAEARLRHAGHAQESGGELN